MRNFLVLCLLTVVLTACGSSTNADLPKDSEMVSVYRNDHTLTHSMEGVHLALDYEVKKITGKVVASDSTTLEPGDFIIELTGTLDNNFEQVVYYDLSFNLQTTKGINLEQISSTVDEVQLDVASGTKKTFTTVYLLTKVDYEGNTELNLWVPAAFKEPNSESSGDALGDFTNWQIPIK